MWDDIFTKEINAFGESALNVTYQTTPCGDTLIYGGVKKGNQMKIKEKNQRKTKPFKTNKHFITPCNRISLWRNKVNYVSNRYNSSLITS